MSNLQKAFKNKARFGLRMAAGGLLPGRDNSTAQTERYKGIDPSLWGTSTPGLAGSAVANLGMSQGLSGAWSMDAGSGAAGTAAQPEGLRAAQPAAPTAAPTVAQAPANPLYKPGTASDPHASALPVAAPRPVVAAAAAPAQNSPTPNMMTPVEELLPSRQGLRLANGGILPVAGVIRNRVAQVDEAVDEAVNGAATPATAAPVAPVDDIDAAVQADMARRAAAREAAKPKGFLKRLGFADGGVIETPDELMARMAKKYGGGAASVVRPQPTPAPVVVAPAPATKPVDNSGGLLGRALRGLRNNRADDYAEGGIVRGKGGVDNVPMNINGVDVNLTGGKAPEAVLPSKTVQALGGPEAVEELIERTNGKPPVKSGLREGGAYGNGLVNISDKPDPRFVKKYGPTDDAVAREKLDSAVMAATYGDRVKPGALATTNDAPVVAEQAPVSTEVTPSASTSLRDAERRLAGTAPEGWATQDFAQETADSELGARVLGPNAAVPQGLRASTDASGGRRLDFTSTNNAANDSMNQGLRKTNGEGVASMRQKDGTFKNIVLGASPTKWADGDAYKAAMEQNAKDKLTLRDMEHARIKRTAAMPGATQGDLVALADQEKSDALYNDQIKNQNDMAYRQQDLGLRRDEVGLRRDQNTIAQQNIIADNQRANAAARALRAKEVRAEVNEHLKNAATGSDGKVDGTKLAWLERAGASVGDTNPDIDPSLFAQKKINHALALRWINDSGFLPNWIKGNLEQDNFTVPNLVEEGDEWVDKGTGQSFSKSSLKKAPLAIQRAIKEMSDVYKKDAATK